MESRPMVFGDCGTEMMWPVRGTTIVRPGTHVTARQSSTDAKGSGSKLLRGVLRRFPMKVDTRANV